MIILHSKQDSLAQYFIFLKMSVHTLIKPLHVVISDTGRLFFRNFLLKCPILPKKGFLCFVSYLSQVDKITFVRQTTKRDINRIAKSKWLYSCYNSLQELCFFYYIHILLQYMQRYFFKINTKKIGFTYERIELTYERIGSTYDRTVYTHDTLGLTHDMKG